MRGSIFLSERRQDLIDRRVADVHQHVGIGEPLHRPDLIPLCLGDDPVQWLSTIVLLQNFLIRHRRHPIVVEFEPPGLPIWFNKSEVVSAVEVTGVYKYTVKLVLRGFGPVSGLVEEFVKVNFEGKFEAIVDLRGRLGPNQKPFENAGHANLDHGVALHVVLVALQLQVQHWRKRLEDNTFPSILQSEPFGLVLVFAIQRFYGNVIPERVIQRFHSLDVQLDIYATDRIGQFPCGSSLLWPGCCLSPLNSSILDDS